MFQPITGKISTGQNGPGNDGNEGLLCIPQSSSITGTSALDMYIVCVCVRVCVYACVCVCVLEYRKH